MVRPGRRRRRFLPAVAALAAGILLLRGCAANPPGSLPLAEGTLNRGYDLGDVNFQSGRRDLVAMVAFSGGGKRSAAFAHGALRGMQAVPVPLPGGAATTLLAELDQVSGVSGGTFPAAHYALHRERSFETFGRDFLDRDIEAFIWGTYLLPWNWSWLVSANRGTNDRMADAYDRLMFRGATYADLIRAGRPRLAIGATDLATGMAFAFLPQPFDLICADLARFPLARAVAASNAFPVLFTPITLENHRGPGCSSALPPFPDAASVAADFRQRALYQAMRRFADAGRTPYLHLMDGGIADNLAMRYVLATIGAGGERGEDYIARILPVRRMLMLVVDGQAATDPALSRRRVVYGLGTIVNAVSGGQIDNYNLETLALAEAGFERLAQRNIALRCAVAPIIDGHPCDDVRFLVARVALADHPDEALRARLQAIPTGLTIAPGDASLLLAAGEAMLRADAPLRDFLASLEPARP